MCNSRRVRAPRLLSLLMVPLLVALAPGPAVGQSSNYRFNVAGVSSTATSMSNGGYGAPYTVSGTCVGSSCSGGLSASGFHDNGSSDIDTQDGRGEILSLAKGESQNNTTASTSDGAGINLSISSFSSAFAEANYSGSYAQSPAIYKMPFRDGTSMYMSWNVNVGSNLTVTNLTATTATTILGGTAWATATWLITVQLHDGTIVAQYNQENSGSSFTAYIPANTVVTIGWSAFTGAKAVYASGGTSGAASASVNGQIAITPVGG
jgi:hypothetical protein